MRVDEAHTEDSLGLGLGVIGYLLSMYKDPAPIPRITQPHIGLVSSWFWSSRVGCWDLLGLW